MNDIEAQKAREARSQELVARSQRLYQSGLPPHLRGTAITPLYPIYYNLLSPNIYIALTPPTDIDPLAWNEHYSPFQPPKPNRILTIPQSAELHDACRQLFVGRDGQVGEVAAEGRKRSVSPDAETSPSKSVRLKGRSRAEDYF